MTLRIWWYLLSEILVQVVSVTPRFLQSDYETYYRRCTGAVVHAGGNYMSNLVCNQLLQTEFASSYDGGTAWRVVTRSPFRTLWSVFTFFFPLKMNLILLQV